MIPTLIALLIRSYKKRNPEKFLVIQAKFLYAAKIFLVLGIGLCFYMVAHSQEKKLNYTITKNGSTIGTMKVTELKFGTTTSLCMQSNAKTSFLLTFIAKGTEKSVFENGVLIYSHVYHTLNGTEKLNKKINLVDNRYVISSKGVEEKLDSVVIKYNLICLYTQEPDSITHLYSDRFQKFLAIKTIKPHHYRIVFPDGNYNDYHYQDGICRKIEVNHSMYAAVMELKS